MTIRKLFIPVFFIMMCHLSNAQSDTAFASVRYTLKHVMDTTQPDNPVTTNMVLYLGRNMSNYTNFDREERLRTTGSLANVMVRTDGGAPMPAPPPSASQNAIFGSISNYYKDLSVSKMWFMSYSGGKLYAVEEKTPEINWAITQETKEVMGMQCQKAIGDFKGRTYEAWFCSQLPYSNGPWKLGGLPGLILEASDTKKEVVFSLVSFQDVTAAPVTIAIVPEATKINQKDFKQFQEALERDRQAMVGSSAASGDGRISVSGRLVAGTLNANGQPVKPRQMNNPIEKEPKKDKN